MNPYNRFRTISGFLASGIMLAGFFAFGADVQHALAQFTGLTSIAYWSGVAGIGLVALIVWSVLSGVVLPSVLGMGIIRRWILGRYYLEGSWIQAERGGPNGPRISIVSIKPARNGVLVSSASMTRTGDVESALSAEYHDLNWPVLQFKFRETLPADSGRQSEGFGDMQFDLTGGAPTRYVGCLQYAGADTRLKTEAVKLTNWRERRRLRTLETRRDIVAKYWSALFEGPIVPVGGREDQANLRGAKRSGKVEILRQRTARDLRKSDTTPTADRIRDEFSASGD